MRQHERENVIPVTIGIQKHFQESLGIGLRRDDDADMGNLFHGCEEPSSFPGRETPRTCSSGQWALIPSGVGFSFSNMTGC